MSWDLYMTAVRADAETAEQLADSIRSYRLPKGVTLPDSGLDYRQVIVDASDEPLDDSRKEQLQQSRFLVVVCSPATRTSAAVGERLAVFLSSHDKNSIIAVIASGEPAESFPEMFIEHQTVRHIMPDMTVIEREETIEPVAADLRGDTPARRKQLLRYETVRIAASVLDLHSGTGAGIEGLPGQSLPARRQYVFRQRHCSCGLAMLPGKKGRLLNSRQRSVRKLPPGPCMNCRNCLKMIRKH